MCWVVRLSIISHSAVTMVVESDGMDIDAVIAQAKLPCVVKPDDSGSSIGVSIANDAAELRTALEAAAREGSRILIEQYVRGREVQIGILGDKALPSIEIIPAVGFYDYRNKYQPGAAKEITPAEIPAETEQRLADAALTVFRALNLSAYSLFSTLFFKFPDLILLNPTSVHRIIQRCDNLPYIRDHQIHTGDCLIHFRKCTQSVGNIIQPVLIFVIQILFQFLLDIAVTGCLDIDITYIFQHIIYCVRQ